MNVLTAWKENFLRLVAQGKPESVAASVCKVGRQHLLQELGRDAEFARRLEAARKAV